MLKTFPIIPIVNNHESKSESEDHTEHGHQVFEELLDDVIEHDTEDSKGISANHED